MARPPLFIPLAPERAILRSRLIEDNPEKVVIWLSPSEYIFKTQLESLKGNVPDFPLENVHFYTYAKLMCYAAGTAGRNSWTEACLYYT